jgi:hypothetical protein
VRSHQNLLLNVCEIRWDLAIVWIYVQSTHLESGDDGLVIAGHKLFYRVELAEELYNRGWKHPWLPSVVYQIL